MIVLCNDLNTTIESYLITVYF